MNGFLVLMLLAAAAFSMSGFSQTYSTKKQNPILEPA
jgi:hypothetical protein